MAKSRNITTPKLGNSGACEPARPGARKPNVSGGTGSNATPGGNQKVSAPGGTGSIARPGGNQKLSK